MKKIYKMYKKYIFSIIVALIIAAFTVFNLNLSNNNDKITLSDVTLQNVEALADSEFLECLRAGCMWNPDWNCAVYGYSTMLNAWLMKLYCPKTRGF
jgi:hypothetical protein